MKQFLGIVCIVLLCTSCLKINRSDSLKNTPPPPNKNENLHENSVESKEALSPVQHEVEPKAKQEDTSRVDTKSTTSVIHTIEDKNNEQLARPQVFSEVNKSSVSTSTQAINPNDYTEKQQYENALSVYKQRKYSDAIKLFDTFMSKNPKSSLIPNALYWKGECFYSQNNYVDAILIFKSIIANYPKSIKAPDALLKIGMSYSELGDKDNASLHYRILFEDYPNSTTIATAKKLGITP